MQRDLQRLPYPVLEDLLAPRFGADKWGWEYCHEPHCRLYTTGMSSGNMQAIVTTRGYDGPLVGQLGVAWRLRPLTLGLPMSDIERKQRIAYAIRSAREERRLTRPQLADAVGVGRGAVSDWENGETLPSLLNLGPLCDALSVDADLFAHPPEIPVSPVRRYLREVAEQAADVAIDAALEQPPAGAAPDDQRLARGRKRG
jgi:transcriptional regulator with XRE-family HTH domain